MPNRISLNKRWLELFPVSLIVAAFGPYIFPGYGIRFEHIWIYSLLLFIFPLFILDQRSMLWPSALLKILILLFGITFWTLGASFFGGYPRESFLKYVSSIENYIQPAAIIILMAALAKYQGYEYFFHCLRRLCIVLISLLCLNSIIAVLSIFLSVENVMRPFVESCFGGKSVWELAFSMGRYSGIFNQPVESGLMYSLGLLAWGYLNRISKQTGFWEYIILFFLLIGGALSVSKVLIFGGIPLLIIYWNPFLDFRKNFNVQFILAAIVAWAGILYITHFWDGLSFLTMFFTVKGNTNLLELYTAGRFGAEYSTMISHFNEVWQKSPLYGFGFGAISCFDNAYLEFFLQGGLVALTGYLTLLVVYFRYSLSAFRKGYEEGRLLLGMFVLVMGGSLGAPVLTINRFSTVFWVFSAVLMFMSQAHLRMSTIDRPSSEGY